MTYSVDAPGGEEPAIVLFWMWCAFLFWFARLSHTLCLFGQLHSPTLLFYLYADGGRGSLLASSSQAEGISPQAPALQVV